MLVLSRLSAVSLVALTLALVPACVAPVSEGDNTDIDNDESPATSSAILDKPAGTALRVASYNVRQDSIFAGRRKESFGRLARAVNADVWCMQEVSYGETDAPASEGDQWVATMRSVTGKQDWKYSWDRTGRYLLSRYPIKWNTELRHRVHASWIDLPSQVSAADMVVVNVHLAPGDKDQTRRDQAAAATDFANKVRGGTYVANGTRIPSNVTILFCGDFNATPGSGPYKIANSLDSRFVDPSYNPSYTAQLTDVKPVQTGSSNDRITHGSVTFRNGAWSTSGATYDYLFYRSSTLQASHSFTLNTLTLSDSILNAHGLKKADVAIDPKNETNFSNATISVDHLPLVVDFRKR